MTDHFTTCFYQSHLDRLQDAFSAVNIGDCREHYTEGVAAGEEGGTSSQDVQQAATSYDEVHMEGKEASPDLEAIAVAKDGQVATWPAKSEVEVLQIPNKIVPGIKDEERIFSDESPSIAESAMTTHLDQRQTHKIGQHKQQESPSRDEEVSFKQILGQEHYQDGLNCASQGTAHSQGDDLFEGLDFAY